MNKHLIIFFGQYRNFNHIVPQLKLDGFDVITSTWDMKFSGDMGGASSNWREPITEEDILKFIPHAKVKIWNHEISEEMFRFRNTANMLFHLKASITEMDSSKEYESISLHRFDLFSNIHLIQSMELKEDVLYCDMIPSYDITNPNTHGIQDWLFFGKPNVIKKYIETFEYSQIVDSEAHLVQGRHLIQNIIQRESIQGTGIEYTLLKDFNGNGYSSFLESFNSMGVKYFDLNSDSELIQLFKQNIK